MFRGDAHRRTLGLLFAALVALVGGCRQKMADQPSYTPLQESAFFDDGMASRRLVAGTIARGQLQEDDHFYRGKVAGEFVTTFPSEVDLGVLYRGQERYSIYCSPCHGPRGDGDGMIVQRGYRTPPPFHTDQLRERPVGYLFDVITNGFGVMPPYAAQVPPEDRWAIVAYVRALQLSQHGTLDDLPPSKRLELLQGIPVAGDSSGGSGPEGGHE